MATFLLLSHGACLAVDAPDEVAASIMEAMAATAEFEPGAGSADADARFAVAADGPDHWILHGERSSTRCGDLGEVGRAAVSELHLCVAVHARDALFIHAGVVAHHGVGVVIPGRSTSGKSTLVRALVAAGAEYFSDEYAVVDDRGLVYPYPKPISVRGENGVVDAVDPSSVGQVGRDPVPVGVIVSTRFDPGATWAPRVVAGAQAVLPLVDNTVAARIDPERMLDVTTRVVASGARCLIGPRPQARDAAAALLADLDEQAAMSGPAT